LNNLTSEDVFFGRGGAILKKRNKIKMESIAERKCMHRQAIDA